MHVLSMNGCNLFGSVQQGLYKWKDFEYIGTKEMRTKRGSCFVLAGQESEREEYNGRLYSFNGIFRHS